MDVFENALTVIDRIAKLQYVLNADSWSANQSFKLCDDGEDRKFPGKSPLLDLESFSSVSTVAKELHRLETQKETRADLEAALSTGFCVVHSASQAAFFLLYRSDKKECVFKLFNKT